MLSYILGVELRPLSMADAEVARLWRNDEAIWKWCRQNDLISHHQQMEWYKRQGSDPQIKMYSIYAANEFVGVCGLTSIDHVNSRAEFSLYIAPEHQRMGYARKALKCLLMHAFKNLGLNLVWGETFDGNPAAKMFEELGFKKEGTRREFYFKEGKRIDCHLYSILASELKI